MKVKLTENNLASFILTDVKLEKIPEPYRLQPSVEFQLPFEEYIIFLQKYLGTSDVFYTRTDTIRHYLNNIEMYKHKLFCIFQKDLAIATLKEVYFAEAYNKVVSKIKHTVSIGNTIIKQSDIQGIANNVSLTEQYNLCHLLKKRGYDLKIPISKVNIDLYNYALALWYMSSINAPYWQVE